MSYLFQELFFQKVKELGGGMVNCHAHLDRAYTLTAELWDEASALMEEKWILNRKIKQAHTEENLTARFDKAIAYFKEQGINACRTHVDVDSVVGTLVAKTTAKIREKYKGDFILQLVAHPLEGFLNENNDGLSDEKIKIFEEGLSYCDVVGGLPSRDRVWSKGVDKHLEILVSMAKNFNYDLDIHTDQENNPEERDTEYFADFFLKNKLEGRVTLVHCISLAAQAPDYRQRVYEKLKNLAANISVCPKAAVSMKQHGDKIAPLHNSIAPVTELLEAGINVSLGTDNISDIFVPNDNGEIWAEIDCLVDSERLYDLEKLAQMVTINGRKTLKIN